MDILLSASADANPKKRKSPDSTAETLNGPVDVVKRIKTDPDTKCYYDGLPDPPRDTFSLFLTEDFRDHFCRCPKCYPQLKHFPQLLEEEEAYEPPLSNSRDEGSGSVATGSLLERGEAALSNVDRVRAIGKFPHMQGFGGRFTNWYSLITGRGCHGVQPLERQSEIIPPALRREWPGCRG